jgi:hypothetical protein
MAGQTDLLAYRLFAQLQSHVALNAREKRHLNRAPHLFL